MPKYFRNVEKLRPYQLEDAAFLSKLPAAACLNEQRTGKTPTALLICDMLSAYRIVIICPTTAMPVWEAEILKWTDGIKIFLCSGTYAHRQKLIDTWYATTDVPHALIISYDCLKTTKKIKGHTEEISSHCPDMLILDEAHRIRTRTTAQATACFTLGTHSKHRLVLTGTIAMNHTYDIWSILHFLYPKIFKSYWTFINKYYITRRESNAAGQTYMDIVCLKNGSEEKIQGLLRLIATQRKRKEVMQWLPDKDHQPILLHPTVQQQKYLQELTDYFEIAEGGIETVGVLDRLIRYRQICLDPSLLKLKGGSPKTDWLNAYLIDYPDTPTLIFSKFTQFITMFAAQHPTLGVITGDTPMQMRGKLVQDFQTGKINQLFLNIDAAREALTLDRAETVIFTDKYPPIGSIEQAEDRFVSTTPDKKDKPHLVISLCLKGTYDEIINRMLQSRKSETDIVNDFKRHIERRKR